jgi:Carbohydrate binding domain
MTRSRDLSNDQANVGGAVAPYVAGKNKIINGDFGVWQRGTSFSGSTNVYTADRWWSDNPTTSRQSAGLNGFNYCLQTSNTPGNPAIRQGIELPVTGNAGQFYVGSTWTVSFWAKTSTTVSSPMYLYAAFSDSVTSSGGNQQSVVANNLGNPTTSWVRYSTTFTISASPVSTNTCLMLVPYLNTGAYSGNFSITGVQLEAGSVATPFTTASGTLQGELALCQRYYYRIYSEVTAGPLIGSGQANSSTNAAMAVPHPVPMRAIPSFSISGGALTQASGSRTVGLNSSANNGMTSKYMSISAIITSAQLTAGYATQLVGFSGSTTDYLEASAEL